MDCAVIYSEAALADLEQITAFIAADNVEAAEKFANRLVDLAEITRINPRARPTCKEVARRPRASAVALSDFLSFRTTSQTSGGTAFLAWSKRSE